MRVTTYGQAVEWLNRVGGGYREEALSVDTDFVFFVGDVESHKVWQGGGRPAGTEWKRAVVEAVQDLQRKLGPRASLRQKTSRRRPSPNITKRSPFSSSAASPPAPLLYKRSHLVRGDALNVDDGSIDFDVVTELALCRS